MSEKRTTQKRWVNRMFLIGSIVLSIAYLFPDEIYLVNLMKTFSFFFIAAYLLAVLYYFFIEHKIGLALLAIFMTIYISVPIKSRIEFQNLENTGSNDLKVIQLNLLYSNSSYEKTIDKVLEEHPDFISVQETNAPWYEYMNERLSRDYPYNNMNVKFKPFGGLAVFSKYPIDSMKLWYVENVPVITGDIRVADHRVHFLTTHTHSPVSPWKFRSRNRHIREISRYLAGVKGPKLILGDFNAVPWDSSITSFQEKAKVVDSRPYLSPTFPSRIPVLKIPIDYVFHSKEIACVDYKRLKQTYSDHYGIVCGFTIK